MKLKMWSVVSATSVLAFNSTGVVYANTQNILDGRVAAIEYRLQNIEDQLSGHNKRLDIQDLRAALAGLGILLSFGLGAFTLISKNNDRNKDESVNNFRITYADRMITVLSDLDLISVLIVGICDDPLPSSRVKKISTLWVGDITDTLFKMESILQALDRAKDVPGNDWGTGTDTIRDNLDNALGELCDENLSTSKIIKKHQEIKAAFEALCSHIEERLKAEITRRHRGK